MGNIPVVLGMLHTHIRKMSESSESVSAKDVAKALEEIYDIIYEMYYFNT